MFTTIARDIPDSFNQLLRAIATEGNIYKIDRGSFEGSCRKQLDIAMIKICFPYDSNHHNMINAIPEGCTVPNPVDSDFLEGYIYDLLFNTKKEGEDYSYGQRLDSQMDTAIKILRENPYTNQVVLQVAQPSDIELEHPPCLREMELKVINGKLNGYVTFRSNDIFNAYLANIASLAVVKDIIAYGAEVEDGCIYYTSSGCHIYDHQADAVERLLHLPAGSIFRQEV